MPMRDGGGEDPRRTPGRARQLVLRDASAGSEHVCEMVAVDASPGSGLEISDIARALGQLAKDPEGPFGPADADLTAFELSDTLAAFEQLRSALGALEIRVTTALDERLREEDTAHGVAERDHGRRTAGEIRMASRISPALASARLNSGKRLVRDMPRMFEALADGRIGVDAAHAIGRSSGPLEPEQRREVDQIIAAREPDLDGASPAQWSREVSALAQQLDPRGEDGRHLRARMQRGVTVTPGAHGMGHVHAHLSALDSAAIHRRLTVEAQSLKAQGDERTHAQIMADLFSDTLLGRDEQMDPVHLEVGVVITERTLITPDHGDPAMIEGYGAVPPRAVRDEIVQRLPRSVPDAAPSAPGQDAQQAEDAPAQDDHSPLSDEGLLPRQAAEAPVTELFDEESRLTLRRLFTHPASGELIAMESRARAFPARLGYLVRLRDFRCAGPYCSSAIRQIDHIEPHAQGGATSADDGQGLCAYCNSTKELLGTAERVGEETDPHRVHWRSKLGRTATVSPSPLTGLPPGTPSDAMPDAIPGAPPHAESSAARAAPAAPGAIPSAITAPEDDPFDGDAAPLPPIHRIEDLRWERDRRRAARIRDDDGHDDDRLPDTRSA
ncbi:HNH endonuclease signature motif containing protein [Brachybacterium sp. ACRRE]|uniref:HNH endonuclease n=1 Tax=Brachybacterium sp. ACRRE TaxID=2918184 RepID=UPI001EF16864|nr:HNH endonuclease signature motif containing protein [Brachybacterium sp. ACRRE]MCG7309161.1 HNH endonuclease [Brachybacterium sp. ACRRE]